jgi:hypothetical protein
MTAHATSVALEEGMGYSHTAILEHISPRVRYLYQVGSEPLRSKVFTFFSRNREPLTGDAAVTFYTYGDMGVHFKTSRLTLDAVSREPLDLGGFVMHVGDLAYAFKNYTRWKVFMENIEAVASQLPYMIAVGNRDDLPDINRRFALPSERPYYSFRYGWVFGIVVAVGGQEEYGVGSVQLEWLEGELKRAHALKQDSHEGISWIVVMISLLLTFWLVILTPTQPRSGHIHLSTAPATDIKEAMQI